MAVAAVPVDYDPFSAVDPTAQFGPPAQPGEIRLNIGGPTQGTPQPTPVDFDPFKATVNDSVAGAVAHDTGLAGRAVVQGIPSAIFGLPALGMDAYDSLVGLTDRGINAIAGKDVVAPPQPFRHSRAVSDLGEQAATSLGLPEPQTQMERGLTDIGSAAVGAGGGAGLAGWIARSLASSAPATSLIMKSLADAPLWQTAGAAGGVAATEAGRAFGVKNPLALMALNVAGSMTPGAASTLGERTALGAKSLAIDPFTENGRNLIAGTVLNRLSTNPTIASQRMDAARPIIPGSNPTIAQLSQDPGLIAAERPMIIAGSGSDARLNQRLADQNLARNNALDSISMQSDGSENPARGSLEYAKNKRDNAISQNLTPALASNQAQRTAGQQLAAQHGPGIAAQFNADLNPVFDTITNIRSSPNGKRQAVSDAMDFADKALSQDGVASGDAETLYAVRKDLADARDGKYNTAGRSDLRLAKGQLASVINALDGAIEKVAPGFRRYLDLYSKRSRALNQTEAINNLRANGRTAVTDPVHGVPVLTMGKFGAMVRKAIASGKLGKGPGNANLSQSQIDVLTNIVADLDRGSAAQAGTVKTPGSDTFKNFTVANAIGRIMGKNFPDTAVGKAAQTVARPLEWMYHLPDEAVGNILVEAALNPKLAARLMRQANRYEMESVGKELSHIAAKQGLGSAAHNQN